MATEQDKLIDYAGVAERAGVTVGVARLYLARARKNRKNGTPRPGDLPEPDVTVSGKFPAWRIATIEDWLENRPGAGRGNRPNRQPPAKRKSA